MAQQPSLAAATIANQRDSVAAEVFGTTGFANLSADNQTKVTTEGNAAFYEVTQWARWFTTQSPDAADLPSEFNEVFRACWVNRVMRFFRSAQEAAIHQRVYVDPVMLKVATHFTNDWNNTAVLQDDTFTPQSIRRSVIARCIRQSRPVYPPIIEIDGIIRDEFVKMWNERPWEFRKRSVSLTIGTDGSVTTGEALIFDGMLSRNFNIADENNLQHTCQWIDATRFSSMAARYSGRTGRPLYFYDLDEGDVKGIQFLPMPDKAYTAYAVVIIGAPAFAGAASNTGLSKLPVEFRMSLRDMAFAKAMMMFGEERAAQKAYSVALSERNRLAQSWDDKGSPRHNARGHAQRQWINNLTSANSSGVIGQSW